MECLRTCKTPSWIQNICFIHKGLENLEKRTVNENEYDNFISENINTTAFYGNCTFQNEIITFTHLPNQR